MADADVVLVSTHGLPDDTARLTTGAVRADVTGRWSAQNESIEIAYTASAPIQIRIQSRSTWQGTPITATSAWDVSVKEPGNVMGRPLLGTEGVKVGPGLSPKVLIIYDRTSSGAGPRIGDEVSITVPMPDGPRPVRFKLAGE